MDRAMIVAHLAQAERHVADSMDTVLKQGDVVARLDQKGLSTGSAAAILVQLEYALTKHIEHRDRLRAQLANDAPLGDHAQRAAGQPQSD
jgi:hypothetical protein